MMIMSTELKKTVSVFKTNVLNGDAAQALIQRLASYFPAHRINFDLEDCDHILRIEGIKIDCTKVIDQLQQENYQCELLEIVV
jgi:hypothetical protein